MKLWSLLFLMLLLAVTSMTTLAEPNNASENQGIPQRVALVEKVLEVERLTQQPTLDVLGTDYLVGDDGKLQSYLKVGEFPVSNATCYVSALYPNMTYFLQNEMMDDIGLPYFEGLYYYDFVVPNTTGVYPVNSYCFYDSNPQYDLPISRANNFTLVSGEMYDLGYFDEEANMTFTGGFFADETLLFEIVNPSSVLHLLSAGNAYTNPDTSFLTSINVTSSVTDDNAGTGVTLSGLTGASGANATLLLSASLNEVSGNISFDASNNTNNGLIYGSPNLTVSGISATGVYFDGIDDKIVYPNISAYVVPAGQEMMFCFGYNSYGTVNDNDVIVDFKDGNNDGFLIDESAGGGKLKLTTDYTGSGAKTIETTTTFLDSNKHTICVFSNSTNIGFYVDGALNSISAETQTGILGGNIQPFYVGSQDNDDKFLETAMLDELCYIKGTTINKTKIAYNYNLSKSCSGTFNTNVSNALRIDFPRTYDGISSYTLSIDTPGSNVQYTLLPYINNVSVTGSPNATFTTNGAGNYEINITNLVDYMTTTHNLSGSYLRLLNNNTGFISEIELDREVVDFSNLSTCEKNYCHVTYEYEFPPGFYDEFLYDARIIFHGYEQSDNVFALSFYNYTAGAYQQVGSLSGNGVHQTIQAVMQPDFVDNQTVLFRFSTTDFLDTEYLYIDRLEAVRVYNGSYVYSLRGNDELVVSKGLQNLTVTVEGLTEADINVIPDTQLAQVLIIILFFVLLFNGWFIPASILSLAYSFIYLDGLLTLIGAGISVIILYGGWKNNQHK